MKRYLIVGTLWTDNADDIRRRVLDLFAPGDFSIELVDVKNNESLDVDTKKE